MSSTPALVLPAPPMADDAGPACDEVERYTRWETDASGVRRGVSTLQVWGLHCAACAGLIEGALQQVPGVSQARVSAGAQRALVRWDPRLTHPDALVQAVRQAGYGAAPDVPLAARAQRRLEHRGAVWRLFVAGFLAMQVMMLATPSYVAEAGELPADLRQLLNWGSWMLSLPVVWFAGMPYLQGAWRSLRSRRLGMDVPVALGVAVTFLASTVSTFDPTGPLGPEVYFDSLTMFLAFLWLGRLLEVQARHRAAEALEATLEGLPTHAWRVQEGGDTERVDVGTLRRGDRVRVPAGETIPADGPLLSARAEVSEALITGESASVGRHAGQPLLAGSLNLGAPLEMQVDRVGVHTRHEAIVALMREALTQRPAAARLADRWAGPFLGVVLALAAAAGLAWWFIEPARALWVVVAVLVVTCPCALSLATPATLVAAAGGLARSGVLLRRLDVLQAMTGVDRVFLDKTGTLSEDRLEGHDVQWVDAEAHPAERREAVQRATSLAAWSSHPLSRALVVAWAEGQVTVGGEEGAGAQQVKTQAASARPPAERAEGLAWHSVEEQVGRGLQARDERGRLWRLGARAWAVDGEREEAVGERGTAAATPAHASEHAGAPTVTLSCQGRPLATFTFREALRPQAAQAVQALAGAGLRPTLLSGDAQARAEAMAQRLGISECHAGVSPEGKLALLRAAQARGERVAMVGDGLNDAPVLAAADVAIAMGQGAAAAREGADAVIVAGGLQGVGALRATALRSARIIRQNLTWAVAYNILSIPMAMAGWLPPWAAGLGMAASSLAVMLNAQRAGRGPAGPRTPRAVGSA